MNPFRRLFKSSSENDNKEKKEEKELDLLDPPMELITFLGLNPRLKPTLKTKLNKYVFIPLSFILYCMVAANFFFLDGSIEQLAEAIESISSFSQLFFKQSCLILFRTEIAELMNMRDTFWKSEDIDEESGIFYRKIVRITRVVVRMMNFCYTTTVYLIVLKTILSKGTVLPQACWIPSFGHSIIFPIVAVFESMVVILSPYGVLGFDALFATFCIDLTIQFQLLGKVIERLDFATLGEHELDEKLKKCVQHHVFLCEFVKKLNKIFSFFFLVQYFISITAISMQFYIMTDESTTNVQIGKSFLYSVSILEQLALFCFPSSFVTESALDLTDAVNATNWHLNPIRDQKYWRFLSLILVAAQKPLTFTAVGMFYINRDGYIYAFRTAFSFYTLMRTINH